MKATSNSVYLGRVDGGMVRVAQNESGAIYLESYFSTGGVIQVFNMQLTAPEAEEIADLLKDASAKGEH